MRVVAPASPPEMDLLGRGVEALSRLGLRPSMGPNVARRDGLFAGADESRAQDLEEALTGARFRAVFYARGGYGTTRLLPLLPLEDCRETDPLLVGYSDATALGLALSRRTPLPFLYAPTVVELGASRPDHHAPSLKAALMGEWPGGVQEISGLTCLKAGQASGTVLGGCLSLLVSLLGTPYLPAFRGRILFIEEVGEEPYRIDRMLTHLREAGLFKDLAGLLVGRLTGCAPRPERSDSVLAGDVVAAATRCIQGPVLTGLPVGHGAGRMTIPLGVTVEMDATHGRVRFLHS
ncbi:MAG: LD-carboxypeptidase [Acidobacteriota bacterium]